MNTVKNKKRKGCRNFFYASAFLLLNIKQFVKIRPLRKIKCLSSEEICYLLLLIVYFLTVACQTNFNQPGKRNGYQLLRKNRNSR